MKKLKIELIGILMALLLLPFSSFSQIYEKQSSEVKNQMDLNKINGVSLWNNISTSFDVYTEGLSVEGFRTVTQRASLQSEIFSINMVENGKVILVCKGGTPFDSIKKIFSNIVTDITKIEENNYIQKKINKWKNF